MGQAPASVSNRQAAPTSGFTAGPPPVQGVKAHPPTGRNEKETKKQDAGECWQWVVTAPARQAAHTTGTAKCVWHQTIISPEVCEAAALGAVLTAKQPAMSANKTACWEASLSLLLSPHWDLGFVVSLFFFSCVVLPAGALK